METEIVTVKTPSGDVDVKVRVGMSDADIGKMLRERNPELFQTAADRGDVMSAMAPGENEGGWETWGERFQYGLGDVPHGAMQLLLNAFGTEKGKQTIANVMARREREYAPLQPEGMDWPRTMGNIAATAPAAFIPGAGTAGGAAAIGAGTGALQPVPTDAEDFWTSKAYQAGFGGVGGLGGHAVVTGFGRVINPNAVARTAALRQQGVTPTVGQSLGGRLATTEQKLSSVPVLGDLIATGQRRSVDDLNRAVINRVLAPIGQKGSGKIGREGIEETYQALNAAYDDIKPRLRFRADSQLMTDLGDITRRIVGLPKTEMDQFDTIVTSQLRKGFPGGVGDGEAFKSVESELARRARNYMGDASGDKRELGRALQDVTVALRANLERVNPDLAPELQRINQAYGNFVILRDAAARQGSKDGVFTPAGLRAAVRYADRSLRKGRYARGRARMQGLSDTAYDVLGPSYPDSGTAGRMLLPGLGAGAATGVIDPTLAAGGAIATLPYLPGGRQIVDALVARRPAVAGPIQQGVNRLAPLAGPVGGQIAAPLGP